VWFNEEEECSMRVYERRRNLYVATQLDTPAQV